MALAFGCAQIGPVLPPSAGLPRPVADFAARRSGDTVVLQWTPPSTTSDGVPWAGPVSYNLCVWPGVERGRRRSAPVALPGTEATVPQVPSPPPAQLGSAQTPAGEVMPACPHLQRLGSVAPGAAVSLPGLGASGGFATLALYALNARNQGAGWSNAAAVPLTAVAAAPHLASVRATAAGVALQWSLPPPPLDRVLVYRDGVLLARLSSTAGNFLDTSSAWNQTYHYWLRSGAGAGASAVESQDSNVVTLTMVDTFPPPVPEGLQAVRGPGGTGGVDLSWNAVVAKDLAGYFVYRSQPGGGWERRNGTPLPTPVFHDDLPASAAPALYAVTSMDALGNESARSATVEVGRPNR